MDRRCFLKLAAALPMLASPLARAAVPVAREFVLLGRSHLFAIHRLQYSAGRNFQIALRLRLRDSIPRRWRRLRRRDEPVLLQTTPLDLRTLRPGSQRTRSLQGRITALDGRELVATGEWPIMAVQVYAQVDPEQARTRELEYYLFGHLREWFGLHVIGGAPDFEQIIRLPRLPADERLRLAQANTAVNARRAVEGRRELHFATLPQWSA